MIHSGEYEVTESMVVTLRRRRMEMEEFEVIEEIFEEEEEEEDLDYGRMFLKAMGSRGGQARSGRGRR